MRALRLLLIVLLSVVSVAVGLLIAPAASASGQTFRDVSTTNQFFREIEWMAARGISSGYPDGTYRPVTPVLRDAMSAFIYRYAGSPPFTPPVTPSFRDVPAGSQFYKEIEWMRAAGISTGYPDGSYQPYGAVNRDAMAAFMYRFAGRPPFFPPAFYGQGMYRVGADIGPGLYRSVAVDYGYWARLSGAGGTLDEIIANFFGLADHQYVQITPTDAYFESDIDGDWELVDPAEPGNPLSSVPGDGMFRVGYDIQPGTYTAVGDGYWERLRGARGELADIITNGLGSGGTVYVTIQPTDAFFATSGFSTWTRVG